MAPFIKGQGGRKKGSLNRATIAKRLAEAKALEERMASAQATEMPLDYMLRVMRDPVEDKATRGMMARAAAPYCHPQLQAVAHKLVDEKGNPLAPVVNLTVSSPKLEDKTPRLTHDGAKKGESVQ
jgi:hypothetical protein